MSDLPPSCGPHQGTGLVVFPDISHYEKCSIDPAALDVPALINKVSQGSTFTDSTWLHRSQDAEPCPLRDEQCQS